MQIRCKFDGGKVINRSQCSSFHFRCYGARLQKNLGKTSRVSMWEKMTGDYPNEVFVDAADLSAKRVEKDRERKATVKAKASRRKSKYSHHDNSVTARRAYTRHDGLVETEDIENDILPEYLDQLKMSYYSAKVISTYEKDLIEEQSREQSNCSLWAEDLTERITASRVGSIARMKKTTKMGNKYELLYSTFRGNKATMYGILIEDKTREDYLAYQHKENHPALTITKYGLVVSMANPWLAASPDGVVHDPNSTLCESLVECKAPFSLKQQTIEEAYLTKKSLCLEKN